jgi:uncharacterized repeat protein (TIGR03803 family)
MEVFMHGRKLSWFAGAAVALVAVGLVFCTPAHAQVQYQFQILHAFTGGADGGGGKGLMIMDTSGNLYGAAYGGKNVDGMVFELTPGINGQWTETVLYNFPGFPGDGIEPLGIVMDQAGNVYGTTAQGGLNKAGTVFELTPGANGQWTESILWNFCSLPDCADGAGPSGAPTLNPAGGLFGATKAYPGTVYELTPSSDGWTLTTLYNFCPQGGNNCPDGSNPIGPLALDARGDLYGEAAGGTGHRQCGTGCGVVYVLHPEPQGQWEQRVLHDFQPRNDSVDPGGGLTLHGGGIFGTSEGGGGMGCEGSGCGTVFELTNGPNVTPMWPNQILHAFGANEAQGVLPLASVAFDGRGDLFSVTGEGGNLEMCPETGCGVVFGMKPQGNGQWAFAVLHTFDGSDGVLPDYGLLIDSKGNLYGTTLGGGEYGYGVIFELSPVTQASK